MKLSIVGMIANPASGKDIRRLVAYGTTFDNLQKVSIVRRALLGLSELKIDHFMYMPDYYGIVPRALEGLWNRHKLSMKVDAVDMEMTGTQEDSVVAARMMNKMGVNCIITLGGDGTNRLVAQGCGDIPLVPISTGTNNVFPQMVEGTIAGLAAGAVACGWASTAEVLVRTKKLHLLREDEEINSALVDVVILKDAFIGSRAIWDEECLQQVMVTRGEPDTIGISSIAGHIEPISLREPCGLHLEIGAGGYTVMAPIAPGLIRPIPIKSHHTIKPGELIKVVESPCTIALDGEREVEVRESSRYYIKLQMDGPLVVDIHRALRSAVKKRYAMK